MNNGRNSIFNLRTLAIGIVLTLLLTAANIYLSLKIGLTISASIPASIIAVLLFRFLKSKNIFECNIIQAMASAGEATIIGSVFVLPAIILLRYKAELEFWPTLIISLLSALMGGLIAILFRKMFLKFESLKFPEGVAVATVLKTVVEEKSSTLKTLVLSMIAAALIQFFRTAYRILTDIFQLGFIYKQSIFSLSMDFSPALLGVGYIVGFEATASILLGSSLVWLVGVPIFTAFHPMDNGLSIFSSAFNIWENHLRLIGIGIMLVSSLYTLAILAKPIGNSFYEVFKNILTKKQYKEDQSTSASKKLSDLKQDIDKFTDLDIPFRYIFFLFLLVLIGLFGFFWYFHNDVINTLTLHPFWMITFLVTLIFVMGFAVSIISCYLAGLIGVSNLPVSGLAVLTLIFFTEILSIPFFNTLDPALIKPLAILILILCSMMATVIGSSALMMQCFSTSHIIHARPSKQEWGFFIGLFLAAFIVAPIVQSMLQVYGTASQEVGTLSALPLPQASLLSQTLLGLLKANISWSMISIGLGIAPFLIILDRFFLKKKGYLRIYTIAVGMGMLLPFWITLSIFCGGLIRYLAEKKLNRQRIIKSLSEDQMNDNKTKGLLIASGYVGGEAIMGILISLIMQLFSLRSAQLSLGVFSTGLSFILFALLSFWLYKSTVYNK